VFSGGLTDTLAARVALRYQESDGYVDNHQRGDEQKKEDQLARLTLVWAPSDSVQVTAKLSHVDMDADGVEMTNPVVDRSLLAGMQAKTNMLGLTDVMGTIAALSVPGYQASSGSKEYDSWVANEAYYPGGTDTESTKSTDVSVRVDWEIGDLTLTSLSAYSDFSFDQNHDVDFQSGNVVHALEEESHDLYSQEFRLSSDFEGRLNFVAGLYYEEQELSSDQQTFVDGTLGGVFGQLPASALNPALPPVPLSALGINSLWNGRVLAAQNPAYAPLIGAEQGTIYRNPTNDFDNDTMAAFLELTFDLTEELALDVGGRYSEDSKKDHKRNSLGAGAPTSPVLVQNPDGSFTGNLDPLNSQLVRLVFGPLLGTWAHDQQLERDEEHFDPSARLRWQVGDDTMVYLSWSEGYKSGGFNTSSDTSNPDGTPGPGTTFGDESAEAWELGIKTTQWDGRMRISAAVFQTEIQDLQVTSFRGTTFQVGNAAELTSSGVELETQIALTDEIEIGGSLAYLDSQFDSFANASCTIDQVAAVGKACTQDLEGERGPYAPEWSGTVYAGYEHAVGQNLLLRLRVDGMYKDEMYLDSDLDPNTLQDDYVKVNARIALAAADDRWEVALYGRNLTDETTYTFMVDAPLSAGIYAGWVEEPRVWGLQGQYNF
jgi:outer membrane receptor protein involved in Fe transport